MQTKENDLFWRIEVKTENVSDSTLGFGFGKSGVVLLREEMKREDALSREQKKQLSSEKWSFGSVYFKTHSPIVSTIPINVCIGDEIKLYINGSIKAGNMIKEQKDIANHFLNKYETIHTIQTQKSISTVQQTHTMQTLCPTSPIYHFVSFSTLPQNVSFDCKTGILSGIVKEVTIKPLEFFVIVGHCDAEGSYCDRTIRLVHIVLNVAKNDASLCRLFCCF